MGLNNLFTIVTTAGDAALVKGGGVEAEHHRGKREVEAIQGVRDKLKDKGLEAWKRFPLHVPQGLLQVARKAQAPL